jgi:hypothetical protein
LRAILTPLGPDSNGNLPANPDTEPDDETSYTNGTWFPNVPSAEAPCSIVGDAVTVLSPGYFGQPGNANAFPHYTETGAIPATNSSVNYNNAYYSWSNNPKNTPPTNTPHSPAGGPPPSGPDNGASEIACAIIAGNVLTTANFASGGVNNLPRFLEKWDASNTAQVIRGSLVNLYASKVAIQPFHSIYGDPASFFEPPQRVWGYDNLFASGVFPPATPFNYDTKHFEFNDLTADGPPTPLNGQPTSYTKARVDPTWGYPGDTFVPVH